MVKQWRWALLGLAAVGTIWLLTRKAYAASNTVRAYVLNPSDRPFADEEIQLLTSRWQMATEWISDRTGRAISADFSPTFLQLPDTYSFVRNIAETGDLISYVKDYLTAQGLTPLDTERYVVLLRGGGGFAGSIPSERFAMLGDVTIESMLGNPELVIDIIFPELPRNDKWGYVTPDAQTGALVHEMLHLVLLAPDMMDNGIMGSWDLWPNAAVESEVLAIVATSPFFT